jgi:hypothetical protein
MFTQDIDTSTILDHLLFSEKNEITMNFEDYMLHSTSAPKVLWHDYICNNLLTQWKKVEGIKLKAVSSNQGQGQTTDFLSLKEIK